MKRSRPHSAGFALVESLVALAVTVLGVLGITGMEMFLARTESVAAQRTVATRLAQECIETMRSYTNMGTGGIWDPTTPNPGCLGTFPMDIGDASYNRTVTINNAFAGRRTKLSVIDAGHWLAVLVVIGAIVGWRAVR